MTLSWKFELLPEVITNKLFVSLNTSYSSKKVPQNIITNFPPQKQFCLFLNNSNFHSRKKKNVSTYLWPMLNSHGLVVIMVFNTTWSWSHSSWIYNYLCNLPIATKVVSSNLPYGEVFSIQHYLIMFVRNLL